MLTCNYRGFKIFADVVQGRFGVLFRAWNNIGEPYITDKAFKRLQSAKQQAKRDIDTYIRETKN